MIELTRSPIDVQAVLTSVQSPESGASILFIGTTRSVTDGRETVRLNYECHEPLARGELQRLCDLAQRHWPGSRWCVVHRVGEVPVGEASIAIAVSTPHRHDAYTASRWMIDRIKESVPIWKEEHWSNGQSEWIHPKKMASTEVMDSRSVKNSIEDRLRPYNTERLA